MLGAGFLFPDGSILMSLQALKQRNHDAKDLSRPPERLLRSAAQLAGAIAANAPVVAGGVRPLQDALGAGQPGEVFSQYLQFCHGIMSIQVSWKYVAVYAQLLQIKAVHLLGR